MACALVGHRVVVLHPSGSRAALAVTPQRSSALPDPPALLPVLPVPSSHMSLWWDRGCQRLMPQQHYCSWIFSLLCTEMKVSNFTGQHWYTENELDSAFSHHWETAGWVIQQIHSLGTYHEGDSVHYQYYWKQEVNIKLCGPSALLLDLTGFVITGR